MKITKKTLWSEYILFATPENIAQLKEKIDCAIFDFWQIDIGDFSVMYEKGAPPQLLPILENPKATVFECIPIIKACEKFIQEFDAVMKQYYIPPTEDEKRALRGLPEMRLDESMLTFLKDYFGQHPTQGGFNETHTLKEYELAKRDDFIKRKFAKNMEVIRDSKIQTR